MFFAQIRKFTPKDTGTQQKVNEDLTAVLETKPRETSHYELNDARAVWFARDGFSQLNIAMSKKEGDFDHRYHKSVTKNNSSDDAFA